MTVPLFLHLVLGKMMEPIRHIVFMNDDTAWYTWIVGRSRCGRKWVHVTVMYKAAEPDHLHQRMLPLLINSFIHEL